MTVAHGQLRHWVLSAALVVFLCSCASFRGGRLPLAGPFPPETRREPATKPCAYLDISTYQELYQGSQRRVFDPGFPSKVQDIAVESRLFSSITTSRNRADYIITIEVRDSWNKYYMDCCVGLSTALTLALVPVPIKHRYALDASVSDSEQELKQYHYEDYVTTWYGLIFLPISLFTTEVDDQVRDNMVQTLFHDIAKDGILAEREK